MTDTPPIRRNRPTFTDQEALQFHAQGRAGKLEVVPTKPMATHRDHMFPWEETNCIFSRVTRR